MIGDIVGFALIIADSESAIISPDPSGFLGQVCRVLEFGKNGGVLALDKNGANLAMIEDAAIKSSFKCGYNQMYGIVLPPNADMFEQHEYVQKAIHRRGGYSDIVRATVISASLSKGEFFDQFLWI